MRSECSAAGVPVGGNGSACPCAGLWVLIAPVAVGLLPPAFSLCPQAPPGKKTWWNAKAGAAITISISAEAHATAKNVHNRLPWCTEREGRDIDFWPAFLEVYVAVVGRCEAFYSLPLRATPP